MSLRGKGEQGFLICEPYKSEIAPHWRFKTPGIAKRSARAIYKMFIAYLDDDDFVGADMARKFFKMGYTRARTIAGDRTRNLAAAARLDADISAHGLGDRVAVLGALPPERVIELCLGSDLFVLASRFEGYGMALAEAIAHGLPVVSTTAGAISATVPAGTGLLVPPGDVPP